MKRTGLMRGAWPLTLLSLIVALLSAPVPADAQLYRILGLSETDGEPTDPDGALLLLSDVGFDPEENGLTAAPPEGDAEADAWWNAVFDLLRQLIDGDSDR